jgi:hypothetical protein
MIIASSCLFAVLASLAQANNIRNNIAHAEKQAVASKRMTPREVTTRIALTGTSLALGRHPDTATLETFRVIGEGDSPLASGAAKFMTTSYKQDLTCDGSKPDIATFGYLTETCYIPDSATTYSSFAYRCKKGKLPPIRFSSHRSLQLSADEFSYMTYASNDCTGTATTYDMDTPGACPNTSISLSLSFLPLTPSAILIPVESSSQGLIYSCSASPYHFDASNIIIGFYESASCGDFAEFNGVLANHCNSNGQDGYSFQYKSSTSQYRLWESDNCKGTPVYDAILPLGECVDATTNSDFFDYDDDIPRPTEPTAIFNVGTTVTSTGDVSTSSNGDDSSCFVENSLVQLKNGTSIPIQFAQVGDEILSLTYGGEFVYSPVIAFPHALGNHLHAKVVTLTTEKSSVTVSRDHLLPVCSEDDCFACGSNFLSPLSLVPSQDIQPNVCLRTTTAAASAWTKVTSASSHSAPVKGLYTVVTMAAYPVVNGIVASPFGTSHVFPSIYYSLHAFCYHIGLLGVPAVKMALDLMNQQMTALLGLSQSSGLCFDSKEYFSLSGST